MSPLSLSEQILLLLHERGTLKAADLQAATGASQSSISLALAALGEQVCRIGAARSTRYAATKDILGLSSTQPLYFRTAAGVELPFGHLTYLADGSTFLTTFGGKQWLSAPNKLHWFLRALQPKGFLGRTYKHLRPDFPDDPDEWTVVQTLYLAINHIAHPPGAFNIGEIDSIAPHWAPADPSLRLSEYDKIALNIGKTLPAQSSAGGEQPKFLVELNGGGASYQHLLIKFSPPHGTPFGDRWRVLLHLEKLALDILRRYNIAVAEPTIVESTTRTYLESQRFDRIGIEGKRHVVAIDALHDEFVGGSRQHWIHTCEKLVAKKMLSTEALSNVAKIYAFGQYIGNTDMHFGNLSFFIDDVTQPLPLLAPVYDMLPMMWRPNIHSGGLDVTPLREQFTVAGYAREYAEARAWAISFWHEAAQLAVIDDAMREAALACVARLNGR